MIWRYERKSKICYTAMHRKAYPSSTCLCCFELRIASVLSFTLDNVVLILVSMTINFLPLFHLFRDLQDPSWQCFNNYKKLLLIKLSIQ